MRRRALALLVLAVLLSTSVAQAQQWDPAAEVENGASVVLHLSYQGSEHASRSGQTVQRGETREYGARSQVDMAWEGALELRHDAETGLLRGVLRADFRTSASFSEEASLHSNTRTQQSSRECSANLRHPDSGIVEAQPTPEGLRVTLRLFVPAYEMDAPGGCQSETITIEKGQTERESHTYAYKRWVAYLHAIDTNNVYETTMSVLVPYQERATIQLHNVQDLPYTGDSIGYHYCDIPQRTGLHYAPGTCTVSGTLTVTALSDPCAFIKATYTRHLDELKGLPPVPDGANEAALRAWAKDLHAVVSRLLGDHRAWFIWGCPGEVQPDPWEEISARTIQYREALEGLLRKGQLSREGIAELVSTGRQQQLLGIESDSSTAMSFAEIEALATRAAGTMTVEVHSPVSLHIYSADGGHVGWNPTTDQGESTIPDAKYEGAPGGAQTITLPAGFYKVVVHEMNEGTYRLKVLTTDAGVDAEETHFVQSAPGRTTSTHYDITQGWDGPRLDLFPVRRIETPSQISFIDEGPPAMRVAGPTRAPLAGGSPPDHEQDTPLPGVALVVTALALAAYLRRR